jgi:hypothetical protein
MLKQMAMGTRRLPLPLGMVHTLAIYFDVHCNAWHRRVFALPDASTHTTLKKQKKEQKENKNTHTHTHTPGRYNTALLLLTAGADVRTAQSNGYSPLLLATIRGSVSLSMLLLGLREDEQGVYRAEDVAKMAVDMGDWPRLQALLDRNGGGGGACSVGGQRILLGVYPACYDGWRKEVLQTLDVEVRTFL